MGKEDVLLNLPNTGKTVIPRERRFDGGGGHLRLSGGGRKQLGRPILWFGNSPSKKERGRKGFRPVKGKPFVRNDDC